MPDFQETVDTGPTQHRGIVEQVNRRGVLVRVPHQYVPAALLSGGKDKEKLDVGFTAWGAPYDFYVTFLN